MERMQPPGPVLVGRRLRRGPVLRPHLLGPHVLRPQARRRSLRRRRVLPIRLVLICRTQPGLGDACASWECPPYAYCLNGTCVSRKMPGAGCDEAFYDDAECLAPAICRNGKCVTMPLECIPGQPGEMCTFLMVCSEDAYCDLLDNFTCKKRSKAGEACTLTMWRADTCVTGAFCQEDVCVAYAQLGEDCSTGPCDPRTSYCESTTCAEKKYAGELCTNDSECIDDDCDYQGDDTNRCGGPCKMPE